MKTAYLSRTLTDDQGTFGTLVVESDTYVTGELPDRGNATGISCIPAGTYICKWQFSPKFHRNVYHLQDVPGRTVIEIHPANCMGDKAKGFKCELNGCIALGTTIGEIEGQRAILHSRDAVTKFETAMIGQDFTLVITDDFPAVVDVAG